ncbi:MAG: toll/interleukin-1 receptor domain-containing protein [Chloroflexi bacterium]|nr:toll/interleukin-1 receptor domain-containing protein [Chloroflexota bacterium]
MQNPLELPVPDDPVQRIHHLARDLAYGAVYGLWTPESVVFRAGSQVVWADNATGMPLQTLLNKWDAALPNIDLLAAFGYLYLRLEQNKRHYSLTGRAFELLQQPPATAIFISYSRRESSAFAMLILARIKAALGLEPFLDMSIEPGDDWQERLQSEVEHAEYFIALIGPATLESDYVRQEIAWAMQTGAMVFPVWHHGFGETHIADFRARFPELDSLFDRQAIRVSQENPVEYEAAIIQLLNRFGAMPG